MMFVSSSFHLSFKLFLLGRTLPMSEKNQTPTSLSRNGSLLTKISEKSRLLLFQTGFLINGAR